MAKVLEPISDEELKRITVANLRNEYKKLADFYRKIINGDLTYCPHCGQWKSTSTGFYVSNTSPDGVEHYACKECIINDCTDKDKNGNRIDNREKTIDTFRKLNWYFDEKIYNDQLQIISEQTGEKVRSTAVQQWIVMRASLNDYRSKTFSDSVFLNEDDDIINLTSKRKPRKEIIKLFGSGFTTEDYLYLQDQYDDWCARTQVDSKSQQTYIVRICFKLLDIYKAQKAGKETSKLDDSLNNLLGAANLQPRQNVGNASTDSLTFGQLIERWEQEDPILIPEEYVDVDNLSKYVDVWFKGGLSRALNLDNGYSKEYDEYIDQYTVKPPEYMGDDGESDENIYTKIFGTEDK